MEIDRLPAELQNDATALLADSELILKLEKYGQVMITGSYRYDLMTVPDIDICVAIPHAGLEHAREIVSELIGQAFWRGVFVEDFLQFPRKDLPSGIYLGLKRPFRGRFWKVDVWLLADTAQDVTFNEAMARLTDEQRTVIMQIKHWRREANALSIPSKFIYDAVLQGQVSDVESFKRLNEEIS